MGAFTILEMMIVIGIIGFLAAISLPHLAGMTKASGMTTALRQMLEDVNFARQKALLTRSEVDMVFVPYGIFTLPTTTNLAPSALLTNLNSHQGGAYALYAQRSVGDQPGQPHPRYLTDWRYLPQGFFFYFPQLTNSTFAQTIVVSNTITGLSNGWNVTSFPSNYYPFPSTSATNSYLYLPCISFAPSGQLTTNGDVFILLGAGGMNPVLDPNQNNSPFTLAPMWNETPPGNAITNANFIHIDWLTGRAKIEHNQF